MPELEDCDDVVADLLVVILPQNRGSLHVHKQMIGDPDLTGE